MTPSAPPMRRWATEFAVIATGVFVGLAAEGWASDRRETAEAREMLDLVAADLAADSLAVVEVMGDLRGVLDAYPAFLEALSQSPPDYPASFEAMPFSGDVMNPKLRFRTGGYTALLSSGRTAALSPDLAARMSTLYEYDFGQVYETLDIVEYVVNEFFNERGGIWDSIGRRPRPGVDPADFGNLSLRYRSIAAILLERLEALEPKIGQVRVAVLAAAG